MPAYEAYGTNYNAYGQTDRNKQPYRGNTLQTLSGNLLIGRSPQSYFPNVNPGTGNMEFPQRPGVAEGQARMKQIADTSTYKSRRAGGSMVNSPVAGGGSMFVPAGQLSGYLARGYTQQVPPMSPYDQKMTQSLVAQNRAYGESPASNDPGQLVNMQGGKSLGGDYISKGGVLNPVRQSPFTPFSNPLFRPLSNIATGLSLFPAIARGIFGGGNNNGGQAAYAGQGAGNQYANPGANATAGATPNTGPDSQYFAYNPSPLQPRRFDFNYF